MIRPKMWTNIPLIMAQSVFFTFLKSTESYCRVDGLYKFVGVTIQEWWSRASRSHTNNNSTCPISYYVQIIMQAYLLTSATLNDHEWSIEGWRTISDWATCKCDEKDDEDEDEESILLFHQYSEFIHELYTFM